MMETSKHLYLHRVTGEIFAIERTSADDIVASAGPLDQNDLKDPKDPDSYEYSPDRNDWIRSQFGNDKLSKVCRSVASPSGKHTKPQLPYYDPSFDELERRKKKRQKKSSAKPIKKTPQDMAARFRYLAKTLKETANRLHENKSELAGVYILYRLSIERFVGRVKKHLKITLSGAPELPTDDYSAGTMNLADYCTTCSVALLTKRRYTRWQDVKPVAEAIVEECGFDTKVALRKRIGCAKNTLQEAIDNSEKLQRAIRKPNPERKKPVDLTDKIQDTVPDTAEPLPSLTETNEILAGLLDDVRRDRPESYNETVDHIRNMGDEEKQRFAQVYAKIPTRLKETKTHTQYKQV